MKRDRLFEEFVAEESKFGNWFRGEIGQPGCDDWEEWVKIANRVVDEMHATINEVKKRNEEHDTTIFLDASKEK